MSAPNVSMATVAPVTDWFQARTGVVLTRQAARAVDVIQGAMQAAGIDDPHAFVAWLERHPRAVDSLVDRLTIHESHFFRDSWHFDRIAEALLPRVDARVRAGGPGLRAWSAGCAAGEELYSLAILLAERRRLDGAWLLGTDVSVDAVARARTGRYRDWALRGPQKQRVTRWMRNEDDGWRLEARIRDAAAFRVLNLARDAYPSVAQGTGELDLVLCRNVLIYFDRATIAATAPRLASALRPGGWLITGPSDPPLAGLADLEPLVFDEGVFYRRPERAHARPRPEVPSVGEIAHPRAVAKRPATISTTRLQRLAALDPALALERVDGLLASDPKSPRLHWLRATLLVSVDRPDEAETSLRAMIALEPRSPLAHFMLASLRLRAGDHAEARARWERSLALTEDLPADARLRHGEGQSAARLAQAARTQLDRLDALEVG